MENPINILIKKNPYIIESLEESDQTPEICMAAVTQNGLTLQFVKNQTPEICIASVTQNGAALQYVKNQTPEICMAAVTQNGFALKHVEDQTLEICIAAVNQDGWALQYVKNQTPEICLVAVTQQGGALPYVKNQTPEICIAAVTQNGRTLQHVTEQTQEICRAAVTQYSAALQFVRDQTPEICMAAVTRNGFALKHVVDQTPAICQLAYQQSGTEILQYINFDRVKIEEIIEKVETRTIEINVINQIIYKDLQTSQFKYLNKKNNLYETVLDHVCQVYGQLECTNVKNTFEKNLSQNEILKDENIKGLYLIKKESTYHLYRKTIEVKNNGWIRDHLIPEAKTVQLMKYFELSPDIPL